MNLHPQLWEPGQTEGVETQLEAGWSVVLLTLHHHCHPVIITSLVKTQQYIERIWLLI